MSITRPAVLFMLVVSLLVPAALYAAPSKPKPKTEPHVMLYNDAYDKLRDKAYPEAQALLEEALAEKEDFAEAHNNLAFALRKQGEDHFAKALTHYNRAIELKPKLAEAYMYRGVLYVQMGDKDKALQDHETLTKLRKKLAKELEWVIENGKEKEPERFFGVTKKK